MCGLVGIAGKLSAQDHKIFKQLLIADQFRGVDSTGVAAIKGGVANTYKSAVIAGDYVRHKAFDSLLQWNMSALIGHNRAATAGAVNSVNAHPFTHDHITLVHNGTLTDYPITGADKFDVDSEAVCYAIAKDGWEAVLPKLTGAYVLVWHDATDDTLHFAGNGKRSFSVAFANGKLYWASEKLMLQWILDRNKVTVSEWNTIGVGKHVKFSLSKAANLTSKSCVIEEFELAKEVLPSWTGYDHYGSVRGGYSAKKNEPVQLSSANVDSKLKELCLEVGDVIGVYFTSFTPYHGRLKFPALVHGVARGYSDDGDEVACYGVRGDAIGVDAQGAPDYGLFKGEVLSMSLVDTDCVTLKPSSLEAVPSGHELVEGKVVKVLDYEDIKKKPCAFCNDEFSEDEAAESVIEVTTGERMHKECHNSYNQLLLECQEDSKKVGGSQ